MSLLHKEPVKRVEQVLKAFDPKLTVIVLKTSARTAIEAASSLGCEVGAIVKSLLFKTENSFTLCLVAGDRKASIIKIKKTLNIKDNKGNSMGDLRSACYSPHFKKVIGIAMINEPYCKASATGLLEIEGNSLAVKVCDLPFI